MAVKYYAFFAFIWIVGAFLGAILDSAMVTAAPSDLDILTHSEFVTMPVVGTGEVNLPKPNLNFFTSIWNILTFNFRFLTGEWEILRWILFMPLTVLGVAGLVLTFIGILQKTV